MLNFSLYYEKTVTLEYMKYYLKYYLGVVCDLGETVGRT